MPEPIIHFEVRLKSGERLRVQSQFDRSPSEEDWKEAQGCLLDALAKAGVNADEIEEIIH